MTRRGPRAFISVVAYFLARTPWGISIRARGQRGQFVLLISRRRETTELDSPGGRGGGMR